LRANLGKLSVEDLTTSPKPEPQQTVVQQPSNLDALEFKIHAKVRSISVEQNNLSPSRQTQVHPPLSRPSSFLTESTHTNLSTLEDSKKEVLRVPRYHPVLFQSQARAAAQLSRPFEQIPQPVAAGSLQQEQKMTA